MPAQTPSGAFVVYTQADGLSWNDSPFKPPDATRFAKYSSTSAPVVISTVEVSEYGLPVESVSMMESSWFLARRIAAAFRRILDRSTAGVDDHDGKAALPAAIASSNTFCDDVWI